MPGPDRLSSPPTPSLEKSFKRSRREAGWILIAWLVFAVWVVGYCRAFAYENPGGDVATVMGMPSWIFWGIALPWFAATVFTIFFATWVMEDHPLEAVEGEGGETAEEAGQRN